MDREGAPNLRRPGSAPQGSSATEVFPTAQAGGPHDRRRGRLQQSLTPQPRLPAMFTNLVGMDRLDDNRFSQTGSPRTPISTTRERRFGTSRPAADTPPWPVRTWDRRGSAGILPLETGGSGFETSQGIEGPLAGAGEEERALHDLHTTPPGRIGFWPALPPAPAAWVPSHPPAGSILGRLATMAAGERSRYCHDSCDRAGARDPRSARLFRTIQERVPCVERT
jgi:hypothetical protein